MFRPRVETHTCAILRHVAEEKPRIFQNGKDIFYSLGAIVIVMIVAVAFTGMCSFGRDTAENVPVNRVDAATFLNLESRAMNFPVRYPAEIEEQGWVPNSARRMALGTESAVAVGWVKGKDGYMQLVQTDLSPADAAQGFDTSPREEAETFDVDGVPVTLYTSDDNDVRDLRIADLGDVRLVVSGAAESSDFAELIRVTSQTEPIVAE